MQHNLSFPGTSGLIKEKEAGPRSFWTSVGCYFGNRCHSGNYCTDI